MPEFMPQAQEPEILVSCIRKLAKPLQPILTDTSEKLSRLKGIRAVLFDVYGTLMVSGSGDVGTATATDSTTALAGSLEAAGFKGNLEAAGKDGVELLEEGIRVSHAESSARGISFPEVEIRSLWQKVLAELSVRSLVEDGFDSRAIERLAVEYECRVNPTWPMPGAGEVITALQKRKLHLGIVSNAQFYTPLLFESYLQFSPQKMGLEAELSTWSYLLGEAKPSGAMFAAPLATLAGKGIPPGETLYVGNDCLKDIWTASQAGCKTALFAGDKRSLRLRTDDERTRDLKPDIVITKLSQLLDCLP